MSDQVDSISDEVVWTVALMLGGDTLNPAVVSSILEVLPTEAWSKGDKHTGPDGGTSYRPTGLWTLKLDEKAKILEGPDSISQRISRLLSKVPFKGNLREAVPGAETCRVAVFYDGTLTDEGSGAAVFLINPLVVKLLTKRGLELRLDVFLSHQDTDATASG